MVLYTRTHVDVGVMKVFQVEQEGEECLWFSREQAAATVIQGRLCGNEKRDFLKAAMCNRLWWEL